MAKSDMTGVLTLGLVGVGVYFAWPYITGFLTGMTTSLNAAGLPVPAPVPPAATPAPTPAAQPAQVVATDPCANQPTGSFMSAVTEGNWTPNMIAFANALKVPQACQNKLSAEAATFAAAQTGLKAAGLGAVRRHPLMTRAYRANYVRRMA